MADGTLKWNLTTNATSLLLKTLNFLDKKKETMEYV